MSSQYNLNPQPDNGVITELEKALKCEHSYAICPDCGSKHYLILESARFHYIGACGDCKRLTSDIARGLCGAYYETAFESFLSWGKYYQVEFGCLIDGGAA